MSLEQQTEAMCWADIRTLNSDDGLNHGIFYKNAFNFLTKLIKMKTKSLLVIFAVLYTIFIPFFVSAQSCPIRKGTIKIEGEPVPGISIKVKGTPRSTITDGDGNFTISACEEEVLIISFVGFASADVSVTKEEINKTIGNLSIYLSGMDTGFSPYSYWSGAKLSYNVNTKAGGSDNFVGGASILLNSVDFKNSKVKFDVVGNIGNFSSSGNDDENGQKIAKIAQTESGLSAGIAFTKIYTLGADNQYNIRPYFLSGYKLNTFTKTIESAAAGIKEESKAVALNQWHNTLAIEFEGFKFSQKGVLHVGLALNYDLFDKVKYFEAFEREKSSLLSFGASIVLPLAEDFGFLISGVYSKQFSPVYSIGLIIRRTSKSE